MIALVARGGPAWSAGGHEDLGAMPGNLIDNAFKWIRGCGEAPPGALRAALDRSTADAELAR